MSSQQPANSKTTLLSSRDKEINLLDLLLVIVKRKNMVFRISCAAALLTAAFSLLLPNIYTSTALIVPAQEEKGVAGAMLNQLGGLAGLAGASIVGKTQEELYVTMLKSEAMKDRVIDQLNLMKRFDKDYRSDVYKLLDSCSVFTTGKKDGVVTISVEDRNPQWAAAIANAYVNQLGSLTVNLNVTGSGKSRSFLERRLSSAKGDLAQSEEMLKLFQAKNKTLNMPEQVKATIAGVAQLRAQLASQEVRLAALKLQFTDSAPEVKTAKAFIGNLKAQIDQIEGTGGGSIPSVGSIPDLGQEYVRLMRDFKIQESIVEILSKQYELAKINETKDVVSFQVLQTAKSPERKSKPKRLLMVLLATGTAFFIGIFLAFVREYAETMPDEDKDRWREIGTFAKVRLPRKFLKN